MVFLEDSVELIPTPVIEVSDDEPGDTPLTAEEREEKKATIEAEDGHSRMRGRHSKRIREWIWRPIPDEIADRSDAIQDFPSAVAEKSVINSDGGLERVQER